MNRLILPALLLALALAGCTGAKGGASPAATVPSGARPAGAPEPAASASSGVRPTSTPEPSVTPDTTLTAFRLKNWVDIYQNANGRWQEGIEGYQPVSYGGTNSYSWKLGEFQAELYQKTVQGDEGELVVENSYTTSWTLPETITPGTTIRIPVSDSGTHVETYAGRATEKTWGAGSPESYGFTYFGLYVGEARSEGGGGYDVSSLSDGSGLGYVEMDVRKGVPSLKVLEIRVEYTCNDIVMGKIYYYER